MSLFVCATHFSVEWRPFYASSDRIHRPPFTLLSMAIFGRCNRGHDTTRKVLSPLSPRTSSLSPLQVGAASAGTRGNNRSSTGVQSTAQGTRNITGAAFQVNTRYESRVLCTLSRPGTFRRSGSRHGTMTERDGDVHDKAPLELVLPLSLSVGP